MYKRTTIGPSADFSTETVQTRKEWHNTFKVMKGKNPQPRRLYLVGPSFIFEREIESFADKQKLREFSATKLALHECLRDFSKRKGHNYNYQNYARKNLTDKDRYTVKVVDQPLINPAG